MPHPDLKAMAEVVEKGIHPDTALYIEAVKFFGKYGFDLGEKRLEEAEWDNVIFHVVGAMGNRERALNYKAAIQKQWEQHDREEGFKRQLYELKDSKKINDTLKQIDESSKLTEMLKMEKWKEDVAKDLKNKLTARDLARLLKELFADYKDRFTLSMLYEVVEKVVNENYPLSQSIESVLAKDINKVWVLKQGNLILGCFLSRALGEHYQKQLADSVLEEVIVADRVQPKKMVEFQINFLECKSKNIGEFWTFDVEKDKVLPLYILNVKAGDKLNVSQLTHVKMILNDEPFLNAKETVNRFMMHVHEKIRERNLRFEIDSRNQLVYTVVNA